MPTAIEHLTSADLERVGSGLSHYTRIVLAISGGADSLCLLPFAAELARSLTGAHDIVAATFVHGWRPEAEAEASMVALSASRFGIAHHVLRPGGRSPLPRRHEDARDARYGALADLARAGAGEGPAAVVTGHHLDDQAETVLMRLGRGSGVDGLSAMAPVRPLDGDRQPRVDLVRPFLDLPKTRLVATVRASRLDWAEDPSNADPTYERTRLRAAVPHLASAGITTHSIAGSARRLWRARQALDTLTCDLGRRIVQLHDGAFASMPGPMFDEAPVELQIRLLGRLVGAFGAPGVRPRLSDYERVQSEIASGRSATLAGAIIRRTSECVQVFREPGRQGLPLSAIEPGGSVLWDGRFQVKCTLQAAGGSIGGLAAEALASPGNVPLDGRIARPAELPPAAVAGLPVVFASDGRPVGVLHPAFPAVAGFSAVFCHTGIWDERDLSKGQ